MSASVSVEGVEKVYRGRGGRLRALDPVTFALDEGEFVSLVGPSGCGKSTLLMLVAGLVHTSSGEIVIHGARVRRPYTDLGIVFQQDALPPWRTVLDNVLLQVDVRGLDRRRYEPRARALLARVGLAGFEAYYPAELSGGMRQRVALCRALVHDPPLLLMDRAPAHPRRRRHPGALGGIARGRHRPRRHRTIAVGSDADLVVVDVGLERDVRPEALGGLSDVSPFQGKRLRGWPVATIKGGRVVARDGALVDAHPRGRYLPRS